eukprot:7524157-Alexandrium_andersonii.AAC.1
MVHNFFADSLLLKWSSKRTSTKASPASSPSSQMPLGSSSSSDDPSSVVLGRARCSNIALRSQDASSRGGL